MKWNFFVRGGGAIGELSEKNQRSKITKLQPKREFSTNQYTERRTYGRDENGELVVKIDQDVRFAIFEFIFLSKELNKAESKY